jgi:DNA sulfur modification protein DndD
MVIDKILLQNYKCFEGNISVGNLSTDLSSEKRIILFGGLNGTGKTTIFEALLLCLYGRKNKNLWPSKGTKREDYENYIFAITNNNAKIKSIKPELMIEVVLKDIELGEIKHKISVKRTWIVDTTDKTINEKLEIFLLDTGELEFPYVSKEGWDDFLEELIPYDTSQFFFFDGEKIQDFVKDEDKEFAESLEKVLGISLYRKLQEDLDVTRRRILTEFNETSELVKKIKDLDFSVSEIERQMTINTETQENIKNEIDAIEKEIFDIDRETKRITKITAETVEEHDKLKEDLQKEKIILEEKIVETLQEDIPFAITAPICQKVIEQLEKEEKLIGYKISQSSLEPKISAIIRKLFDGQESIPPLTQNQQKFYSDKLLNILEETLSEIPNELKDIKILHELPKNETQQIILRIRKSFEVIKSLNLHVSRLQEIEPKLRDIAQISKKTSDSEAKTLYEKRGGLNQRKIGLGEDLTNLEAEYSNLEDELISKKRQRTELESKAESTAKMQKQMEYCRKMKETLEDFSHELRVTKVNQLQEYTLKMWGKLARKKDQIKDIKINPDNQFTIELFDEDNRIIDKTKLSAGEKELLAISLIWALSQIADRDLPIVIDTPLGRLDSIHRNHIVTNYFPNASHQVILLSTNTEIVGQELEGIRPYISKTFLIHKDKASETSQIVEGYFE